MPGSSASFSLSGRTSHYSSSTLSPRPSVPPPPPPPPKSKAKSKSKSRSAPKRPKPYSAPAVPRLVLVSWLRSVHPGRILSRPPPSAYSTPPQRTSAPPPRSASPKRSSALSARSVAPPSASSAPPPAGYLQLTFLTDSWFATLCVRKFPLRTLPSKPAPPAEPPQLTNANPVPVVLQSESAPTIPGPFSDKVVSKKAQKHKRKRSCEPGTRPQPKKHKSSSSHC
uniref:Uncharacterized protein n=1 Tax=Knipowitschia caucasica TaxID=637954 RepID=A0AAV2JEB0_KNICA